MKTSDMLVKLEESLNTYGDLDVEFIYNDDVGGVTVLEDVVFNNVLYENTSAIRIQNLID